jgi:HEPN domain-containing protein
MEWIEKAEDDWDMAQRAYRVRKRTHYDAACFNAQQCVEKYLKAKLNEASLPFNKTHDLLELLTQAVTVEPGWSVLQPTAIFLTDFAVLYPYPGRRATKAQAQQAIKDCREARRVIRTAFGLPV